MQEDKLSHDERLRLEALAQAVSVNLTKPPESIIELAKKFEYFIKGIA